MVLWPKKDNEINESILQDKSGQQTQIISFHFNLWVCIS